MDATTAAPAFRYAVLRPGPGLPAGFLPPRLDGLWMDLDQVQDMAVPVPGTTSLAVAVATGRFERRDDGATARVYEFRV
jgi:hypothetical protein